MHRSLIVLLVLTLTLTAGCGKGLYPVEGQVVYKDGTPLSGGSVEFEGTNKEVPIMARGFLDENGRFRLSTHQTDDGAYEGEYRILVMPPPRERGKPLPATPRTSDVLDSRFMSFETSNLRYKVVAGANKVVLEIEKPGRKK